MTEKEFQGMVVELARALGWMTYHTFDSRRCTYGFPDLVLVRGAAGIAAELKVGKREATHDQALWLVAFHRTGWRTFCWRPDDWPEIERVLKGE